MVSEVEERFSNVILNYQRHVTLVVQVLGSDVPLLHVGSFTALAPESRGAFAGLFNQYVSDLRTQT